MLDIVAQNIRARSPKKEMLLQIALANMASGLSCSDIDARECAKRLKPAATEFIAKGYTWSDRFYDLLIEEMQTNDSGWYSRRPDLGSHLDDLAVCIGDHFGLAAWMGEPDNDLFKDPDHAAEACSELNLLLEEAQRDEDCSDPRLTASVGKPANDRMPARPLWLTPFSGVVGQLIDKAADDPSSAAANRLCSLLGLSHIRFGSPVVAIVLNRTVGELAASKSHRFAGPTSLEAGGFQHYRHYPSVQVVEPDGFGRTYDLDPVARARVAEQDGFGAPEAIRSPACVRDVLEFVYIGQRAASGAGRSVDAEFLRAIGADLPLTNLLETVGRATRLWIPEAHD